MTGMSRQILRHTNAMKWLACGRCQIMRPSRRYKHEDELGYNQQQRSRVNTDVRLEGSRADGEVRKACILCSCDLATSDGVSGAGRGNANVQVLLRV